MSGSFQDPMDTTLCDECHEKPATEHLCQIAFGHMTTRHLCGPCYYEIKAQPEPFDPATGKPNPKLLERPVDCPSEVSIPDPVPIRELADALHMNFLQVIAVLVKNELYAFARVDRSLDFATASLVCEHFGVTPRKSA
jgi:hypothetical protein